MTSHRTNSPGTSEGIQATWTFSDLDWIVAMYRRHWLLVGLIVILSLAGALLAVVIRGPQYEVAASLYLKLGAEMAPPASISKEPVMVTRRTEDVNTEIEILRSPHLIRKVIQDLGDDFFGGEQPQTFFQKAKHLAKQAVQWTRDQMDMAMIQLGLRRELSQLEKIELVLSQAISVEPVRNADIIYVSMQVPDPKGGEIILQKVLDAYLESHLAAHKNPGLPEFFTSQTDSMRSQLAEKGRGLLAFKTERELWAVDEQRTLLLERQRVLQQQHSGTRSRIASLEEETKALRAAIVEQPEIVELSRTLQRSLALDELENRRAEVGINAVTVATIYTENARELRDAKQQQQYVNAQLASADPLVPYSTTNGINQNRTDLLRAEQSKGAELLGLRSQASVEAEQLADINANLHAVESAIAQYRELAREHDLLERNYLLYSESAEKSRISSVMNQSAISNVTVISPPTASLAPVSPRMKLVLGGAAVVGFALASAIALALEFRQPRRATELSTE